MTASNDVWFAIPSASPENCRRNLPAWRDQGYRIAILQNQQRADIPADIVVWSDEYPGWAGSINRLCREIVPSDAAIVVSGGDDMLPDPDHTAAEIAAQFHERFPDGFGVMQPHGDDYWNATLYCGSPWLGRRWIETMYGGAGPTPDAYQHNWADAEILCVADAYDALWIREDLSQFHTHFTRDGDEAPDYWVDNVDRFADDDLLEFLQRAALQFPGHAPSPARRPFTMTPAIRETIEFAVSVSRKRSLARGGPAAVAPRRMRDALETCAERGLAPVVIYGTGMHTRNAGPAFMEPPVEIACLIDDDPARHGRCWGYPVEAMADAIERGIAAIVLSSDAHEEALWTRCAPARAAGIEVVRLYADAPALTAAGT